MPTDIKVYFVLFVHLQDELSTSEEMQQAFELCRQNQMNPEWIGEAQCIKFGFKKKDILVFDKFEGETYKKLQSTKCLSIVGPWCITTCLLEGLPIPNNNSPVYNMAMYKLNITASNYAIDHKKRIKEKVELMGGIYSLHITNNLTHLITNSIRTEKYTVAREKHLPIMLESWVEDVWNVHQTRYVKATDDEFLEHKCPTFQGLNASCTGFTADERAKLQRVLGEAGGKFSGKMVVGHTDVLICNPGINSEKFTAALKAKIPCVRKEWIYDSYEKGYPLPQQSYSIKLSSSTPTKIAPLNMDFSMMSVISGETMDPLKTTISDTLQPDMSIFNPPTSQRKKPNPEKQKENEIPDHIDTIDLKQVKQAGAFLDGCSVYLVGFSPEKREKLNRILKSAGATRYDDISDRVTQILVGDPNSLEVKVLSAKGCGLPMVSSEWIIECIKKQQPVNEDPFIVRTSSTSKPAPSSPLSKKGLTLLQHNTSGDEPEQPPEQEPYRDESVMMYMPKNQAEEEEDTLAQLLAHGNIDSNIGNSSENNDTKLQKEMTKQNSDKSRESSNKSSTMQEEDTGLPIFEDKTFKIMNFAEEEHERLTTIIEFLNGEVVNSSYKGITDFAVVPTLGMQMRHTSTEVVNDLWVLECHTMQELLEVQYYHQPFNSKTNAKPLENCVITISGYTSFERSYLTTLLDHLGATFQDKFARITVADKSVKASTHLICLEPSGSKYSAALRWHRPVLSHHWLLECAETGLKVEEKSYLLNKNQEMKVLIESTKPEKSIQSKPETPLLSNKRDVKGKKISPVQLKEPDNEDVPETSGKKFKFVKADSRPVELEESPFKGFESQKEKAPTQAVPVTPAQTKDPINEADPIMTLDNGTTVPLSKFMKDLRDQGVFDTPSPVHNLQTGTPFGEIINRLRRDGVLPAKRTPVKQALSEDQPGGSQGTPVGKYIRGLQERNVLPSSPRNLNVTDSPLPKPYCNVTTPDTPLGQFMEDNPSKETRKRWQQYLDKIPQYNVHNRPPIERRLSTPWNEFKKQAWSRLLREDQPGLNPNLVKNLNEELSDECLEIVQPKEVVVKQAPVETESQIVASNQIGQLQDMLKRRDSSGSSRNSLFRLDGTTKDTLLRDAKDSQTDVVSWDEPMESISTSTEDTNEYRLRKFMVSGIEQTARNSCYSTIKSLGGDVSDLAYYDPSATHLICSTPTRNEKILSSMAAGKFIVHISYIQDSGEAGRFLEEELYEFGNAKSATRLNELVKTSFSIDSMHWWRMRVCEKEHGAFHGIRALVFSKNKDALVRVIEAGGGTIVNASPPYTHNVDVTHCFVDPKIKNITDFVSLAEQSVPCLNALYLSNYLNNRTSVQIEEFILPALRSYYS